MRPTIGIEVHAQLLTASKMFCACSAAYANAAPNTHVCAICSGMPGALPAINRRAVEYTLRTALALECRVEGTSKFDRKNYSYPDLPKGYQISQYDRPIGVDGGVEYAVGGTRRRCGIIRVHLEEDTGKTTHVRSDGRDVSLVDYNRSGVPLMEIVSAPDLRSAEEAREYFAALRQILMYLGVCDGNLQEGSMRADVNVSLRAADGTPGTKVEIKNLNSFRAVQRSVEYEVERQRQEIAAGGMVQQETRGWNEAREVTVGQRTKEYADDYRYFPEPDLPWLAFRGEEIEAARQALPELPAARTARFEREFAVPAGMAAVLTGDRTIADLFEAAVREAGSATPREVANWVVGDVLRLMNERHLAPEEMHLTPERIGRLVGLVAGGEISVTAGRQALEAMVERDEEPEAAIDRLGVRQVGDEGELTELVRCVVAENAAIVADVRRGKVAALNVLLGKAMKASGGRANPGMVRELLERELAEG